MSTETLDTRCEATVRGRRCAEEPDTRGAGNMALNPYCEHCGKNLCPRHLAVHRCRDKARAATVEPMAKLGRPRTLSPEDGDKAKNQVIRLTEEHRAELDALIADGHGPTRSDAARYLIEQSAKRRAKREKS